VGIGSISELGADGAGDRAVRIPVIVSRPPRRSRAANDNQAPRHVRIVRWLVRLLPLAAAAVVLAWMMAPR